MVESENLPLKGVRVLDLGQIYLGGYAGFLLAEAGADVVKVEPPHGENLRNRPTVHGAAYPFLALNINKRSICLDLKTASGRDEFLRLVGVADVIFDNFSSGVMKRLNLDYSVLQANNPRIVYASGSGYGTGSRYEDYQAMDLTVQAMAGVMSVTGFPDSPPVKAGVAISDFMAGVHLYAGIVTALLQREHTGIGSLVEVPMLDATLPTLLSSLAVVLGTDDEIASRTGNRHGGMAEAPYNVYGALDGHAAIICVSESQWAGFAEALGSPELASDERFHTRAARVLNMPDLDAIISAWTANKTRDEIVRLLRKKGVPVAPVRTLREVVDDPDLVDRGTLRDVVDPVFGRVRVLSSPIRYNRTPPIVPRPAPALGENRDEVMFDWLGEGEISFGERKVPTSP
jgi:crotonobetainyl-CoA:carnitine CoA-transferase CaiB-like acyl-CoA transferase